MTLESETRSPDEQDEEFNPTGTAFLLSLYFLLLVLLWAFMYFIEFIGGGPTILSQ